MTYKTRERVKTAFYNCYKRYGLRLSFNRGKISAVDIENKHRLTNSGRTLSYVIGKYQDYIRGK